MSRERVIVDIQTLDQAMRVEETVRTGYCEVIKDNLTHWIAVEEDITDSYNRLLQKFVKQEVREGLKKLAMESESNLHLLHDLLKTFGELGQARIKREETLKGIPNL